MFEKILKLGKLLWWFFTDEENMLLHLMEDKALNCIKKCKDLEIGDVEELEDLIFHINSYYEIPDMVKETKFPDLDIEDEDSDELADYIMDVELQRAIERDFIFEHAKVLSLGFDI